MLGENWCWTPLGLKGLRKVSDLYHSCWLLQLIAISLNSSPLLRLGIVPYHSLSFRQGWWYCTTSNKGEPPRYSAQSAQPSHIGRTVSVQWLKTDLWSDHTSNVVRFYLLSDSKLNNLIWSVDSYFVGWGISPPLFISNPSGGLFSQCTLSSSCK